MTAVEPKPPPPRNQYQESPINDLKLWTHDWHDQILCHTLTRLQSVIGLATIPNRYHQFALVVRVNHTGHHPIIDIVFMPVCCKLNWMFLLRSTREMSGSVVPTKTVSSAFTVKGASVNTHLNQYLRNRQLHELVTGTDYHYQSMD